MQQAGFDAKTAGQQANVRQLLNEIIDLTVQINTRDLEKKDLRRIMMIKLKAESILDILKGEQEPAKTPSVEKSGSGERVMGDGAQGTDLTSTAPSASSAAAASASASASSATATTASSREAPPAIKNAQENTQNLRAAPPAEEDPHPFFKKLYDIRGLDAKTGISKAEHDKEKYLNLLRRFCERFDEWRDTVLAVSEKKLWKEYVIRIETLARLFNALGHNDLAERAVELINACRRGNFAFCSQKTDLFCNEMAVFQKDLLATEIFSDKEGEALKERIAVLFEKLKELKDACAGFKANRVNELIKEVKNISIDENIDASYLTIVQLVEDIDYDKAAARVGMLMSILESYQRPMRRQGRLSSGLHTEKGDSR
jgi:hypothetical protein